MHSIEFIGLPGVGKSTLSKGVEKLLLGKLPVTVLIPERAVFYAAKEYCDKSLRNILRLLPEPLAQRLFNGVGGRTYWQQESILEFILANQNLIKFIFDEPFLNNLSDREQKIVVSSLLHVGGQQICLHKCSKSDWWILFDEGILQKSMMFVSSHGMADQRVVGQYLSKLALPDVVVNLQIDKNECIERMLGRSKGLTGRLRTQSREQIETFLDFSIIHWEYVTCWLRNSTKIPIIEIKTDQNQSELISSLGRELEEIIRGELKAPVQIG